MKPKASPKPSKDLQDEARTPRRVFLVLASMLSLGAGAAYFYEEELLAFSSGDAWPFAMLILFLVLASLFMVLCYRVPRVGNRLLGYDIVIRNPSRKVNEGYHYTGAFKTETGTDTKRMNSRRKTARAERKNMAAITREMAASGELSAQKDAEKPKCQNSKKTEPKDAQ